MANFANYGNLETLMTNIVSWADGKFAGKDGLVDFEVKSDTEAILKKSLGNKVINKTWTGDLTSFNGANVWSDGENIYYSYGYDHYVFNKSTGQWETKTWTGLTQFHGSNIWTDGENIYYSVFYTNGDSDHYVLDKATSTWSSKTWNYTLFGGGYVWKDVDGTVYMSRYDNNNATQINKVLNKTTGEWDDITITCSYGILSGEYIWTDGTDMYYSPGGVQTYKLNRSEMTFSYVNVGNGYIDGRYVWTDGVDILQTSTSEYTYKWNRSTKKFDTYTLSGSYSSLGGINVWSDGTNFYYSWNTTHYQILTTSVFDILLPEEPDISGKADKVSSPTDGHLAGLNSSGNLTDSGYAITVSTTDLTAGTSPLATGTIYLVYES